MLLPVGSLTIISVVSYLGLTRDGTWSPRFSGYVTILAIGIAFVLSLWALDTAIDADGQRVGFDGHEWVFVDPLKIDIGITLDGLSAIMLVIVTGVSLLVQVYSQEYMRGDEGYNRYFAFMSLFTASMLGLVIASSILQLFVFWELVGVSSYLLIGFWFFKDSARRAATKAFVVTRFGDLGFLIAILIIWSQTDGELNIPAIHELAAAGAIGSAALTWFALGVFAGAAGKSAQFPLHVWLPDAMEGPTPVSALIHAATMVAAGVYLVARFFPVFAASDEAIVTVAAIGSITTIMAALLGIVATDIKRVLAYSTISQLGYMMMGLGVGGLVAAMFHLLTHAFFKALLFLGAGSVNHATGTFDMRKMGGLRTAMPITFLTMTIGSLALVGLFPLAGFWSKDEILADAWEDRQWVFWVALTGVFMTALYVGRMLIMTFAGEYRGGEEPEHGDHDTRSPHESPILMTSPLVILAVLAATAGFVNIDDGMKTLIEGWLPHETEELVTQSSFELWIAAASTAAGAAGLTVAWAVYYAKILDSEKIGSFLEPLPEVLGYKYYMDVLYEEVVVKLGLMRGTGYVVSLWDKYVIDGAVNGVAVVTGLASQGLRQAQVGQVQVYGAAMFLGLLGAVAGILIINPP